MCPDLEFRTRLARDIFTEGVLNKLGLNKRQIEALRLMVNKGQTFTNVRYREIFEVSNQTFVRDMRLMLTLGLVIAEGRGRAIRYKSNL